MAKRRYKRISRHPEEDWRRTREQRLDGVRRAEAVDMARMRQRTTLMRRGPVEDKMRVGPLGEDLLQGVEFSNVLAEQAARDAGLTRFDFADVEPSGKRGFTKPDVLALAAALEE